MFAPPQSNEKYIIVPSKNTDNLPLTSFKVGEQPCVKPNEIASSKEAQFYPTEIDRSSEGKECTTDRSTN